MSEGHVMDHSDPDKNCHFQRKISSQHRNQGIEMIYNRMMRRILGG